MEDTIDKTTMDRQEKWLKITEQLKTLQKEKDTNNQKLQRIRNRINKINKAIEILQKDKKIIELEEKLNQLQNTDMNDTTHEQQ